MSSVCQWCMTVYETNAHQCMPQVKESSVIIDALRMRVEADSVRLIFEKSLNTTLKQENEALRTQVEKYREALGEIASHEEKTNIGSCCVDDHCIPYYEHGERVSKCSFQFGVYRGFIELSGIAKEALRQGEDCV